MVRCSRISLLGVPLSALLVLSACGGGSNLPTTPGTTPPPPTTTATPQPTPTPTPTPEPTPTPTPKPTPTPTPAPINVGNYLCITVELATTDIDADGFALGTVTSDPAGTDPVPIDWVVIDQKPNPGTKKPVGTSIDLVAADPTTVTSCP